MSLSLGIVTLIALYNSTIQFSMSLYIRHNLLASILDIYKVFNRHQTVSTIFIIFKYSILFIQIWILKQITKSHNAFIGVLISWDKLAKKMILIDHFLLLFLSYFLLSLIAISSNKFPYPNSPSDFLNFL
jgi:hypothetical protein